MILGRLFFVVSEFLRSFAPMELEVIQNKIYEIRGRRVMLDFDLAALYKVETKRLKEQVKRNVERFPDDFMFQLTKREWDELVANCDQLPETIKHSYIIPLAFTEQGVSMLSTVLRSGVAVQASIAIMRAFVAMRNYITNTTSVTAELAEIRARLELLERNDEDTLEAVNDLSEDIRKDIDNLYTAIGELSVKPARLEKPRQPIGYKRAGED
jgi:hypothetical protein